MLALVAQANITRKVDFFTSYPMMLAYTQLSRHGLLTAKEAMAVRDMVSKTFAATTPGSNNQHYQRAAGLVLAAYTYPNATKAAGWLAYGKAVLKLVLDTGDITEDAPNYNRLDFVFIWILADLLNTTQVLRTSTFLSMFERFAQQISPSGVLPAYGDSGAANKAETATNWTGPSPWSNPWGGFVSGFTRAAVEFAPTAPTRASALARAATLLLDGGVRLQPLGDQYGDVGVAFRLLFAVQWGDMTSMPVPDLDRLTAMTAVSGILTRRDVHGPHTPDKVVLRGGSSFLLSDLYGSQVPVPPHAHENQAGQVNYFEVDGVPLISSLGYDNRGPADTNLFLVRDSLESFPHAVPKFPANKWITASVPTRRMRVQINQTTTTLLHLTLRVEWDGKPIVFSASQFKLVGE